jgi:hypothetical protein
MKLGLSASASALLLALASSTFLSTGASAACVGTCGTLGADGVVTESPLGGTYQYVSTYGGINGVGSLGYANGGETNGSVYTVPVNLAAGDVLKFFFNYVGSDGTSTYTDYAWSQLQPVGPGSAITLFTARTTPGGDTVPGFDMPVPTATLNPTSTPIIPGGPVWSPLGDSSGECYQGPSNGCGYTGWIESIYTVTLAGSYLLAFGVTNVGDTNLDLGLAFDGVTINDVPVDPGQTPIPGAAVLMGTVLAGGAGFGAWRRRRQKTAA